jgi:hypothetical protein
MLVEEIGNNLKSKLVGFRSKELYLIDWGSKGWELHRSRYAQQFPFGNFRKHAGLFAEPRNGTWTLDVLVMIR